MAKVKPGLISVSGKVGEKVVVHNKYGAHAQESSAVKSKKRLAVLEQHNKRTKFLNKLGSEINNIVRSFAGDFKPRHFYHSMLSRFRKEPEDNRFLLLQQLIGMEINERYTLGNPGLFNITVSTVSNQIKVKLDGTMHPPKGKLKANCYMYQVLLIYWKKGKSVPAFIRKRSDWILPDDTLPEIDFVFPKDASVVEWLLCVRRRMGLNKEEMSDYASQGMQIVESGSFDKKDHALLMKRRQQLPAAVKKASKVVEEEVVAVRRKTG
jgi:hypothetical protein